MYYRPLSRVNIPLKEKIKIDPVVFRSILDMHICSPANIQVTFSDLEVAISVVRIRNAEHAPPNKKSRARDAEPYTAAIITFLALLLDGLGGLAGRLVAFLQCQRSGASVRLRVAIAPGALRVLARFCNKFLKVSSRELCINIDMIYKINNKTFTATK